MNIPYLFKRCTKCGELKVANNDNFSKQKSGKWGFKGQCKECQKQYREQNKERINELSKQWYEHNKDKRLEQCKQYREQNKEKIAEWHKQHYEQNKERISERNKQYREQNKDRIAEYQKQWREQNKERIAERDKQYRKQNKERIAERKKQWCEQNKEKIAEWHKQHYEQNKERIAEQCKQYRKTPQGSVVRFNATVRRRIRKENQGDGITKEQWLEMMKYFDWKCAYSGETLSEKGIRTIDHITPLVKGGEHEVWNCTPMTRGNNSSKQDRDMITWYKQQEFYSEERLNKIYAWQQYAYEKWGNKQNDVI